MCLCGLARVHANSDLEARGPLRKLPPVTETRPIRKMKAYHHRHHKRDWQDGLMFSNLVYLLAGLISLSCGQYFCALFQIGAAIASSLFHRSKETKYLLVDAIISSTLAIVFIFFAVHTVKNEWYGILGVKLIQGASCTFTWLYCGLPGGARYEKWHQRWHYVSGITTMTTTFFLTMYMPEFDLILHELIQDYMLLTAWFA
ncbi:hypothetical protein Poli38472_006812 [Pythium oligandrum]|uniref:Uncharacterized protein n=1 Tax=Pythium oligandrum TaxID=41045 RepID=A0A8K1C683_PYTOL|nr:hypothetical protein Poli38472_006812 [Pythium oligandrum]|eukprot:TMW56802.1 hypothetical protein Poli38472_006812 [Pythium oligandrum]